MPNNQVTDVSEWVAAVEAGFRDAFDAVRRLKGATSEWDNNKGEFDYPDITTGREALTAIVSALETAQEENRKLKAAVTPFAELFADYVTYCKEENWHGDFLDYLTMFIGGDNLESHGQRAAAALAANAAAADGKAG